MKKSKPSPEITALGRHSRLILKGRLDVVGGCNDGATVLD
jgi:hypothetical protein